MVTDRRKADRHRKRIFARIPTVSGVKDYYLENISLLGFTIKSPKKIDIDRRVATDIIFSKYDIISCDCRIAWVKPEMPKADFFQIGMEFLDLTSEQKGLILEYLNLA